jgi:hypothetical protein
MSVEKRLQRIRPNAVKRIRGVVMRLIPTMICSGTPSMPESMANNPPSSPPPLPPIRDAPPPPVVLGEEESVQQRG